MWCLRMPGLSTAEAVLEKLLTWTAFREYSSWEMGSQLFSLESKGSKRAGSTAEPPMVDQLVTRGVNRGRECMCGQEVMVITSVQMYLKGKEAITS